MQSTGIEPLRIILKSLLEIYFLNIPTFLTQFFKHFTSSQLNIDEIQIVMLVLGVGKEMTLAGLRWVPLFLLFQYVFVLIALPFSFIPLSPFQYGKCKSTDKLQNHIFLNGKMVPWIFKVQGSLDLRICHVKL